MSNGASLDRAQKAWPKRSGRGGKGCSWHDWRSVALPTFGFATGVGVAALSLRQLDHTPFTQRHDDPPALEFGGLLAIGLVLAALGIGASVVAATPVGVLGCTAPALLAALHLRNAPRRLLTTQAST